MRLHSHGPLRVPFCRRCRAARQLGLRFVCRLPRGQRCYTDGSYALVTTDISTERWESGPNAPCLPCEGPAPTGRPVTAGSGSHLSVVRRMGPDGRYYLHIDGKQDAA